MKDVKRMIFSYIYWCLVILLIFVGINICLHFFCKTFLWKKLIVSFILFVIIIGVEHYYLDDMVTYSFTSSFFILSTIWANLFRWKKKHPGFIFSSSFWCMMISISIFIKLYFLSYPCFLNQEIVLNGQISIMQIAKSFARSVHFSINTMLTGAFQETNSVAYQVISFLSNNLVFYILSIIIILIAPLFTLAWIISIFDTDAFLYFRLMFLRSFKRKTLIFYKPTEKNILIAKSISKYMNYDSKYKKAVYGFCRCGKNKSKVSPEVRAELQTIKHTLLLSNTEIDYVFPEDSVTYLLYEDNHLVINNYLEDFKSETTIKRNILLISNEDLSFMKESNVFSHITLTTFSIWKRIANQLTEDIIASDERKIAIVYGKGGFFRTVLNAIAEYQPIYGNQKKTTEDNSLQVIVFPDDFCEYIDLSQYINESEFTIIDPTEYEYKTIEADIVKCIASNIKQKISVVISFDNAEDSIKVKRRIVKLTKSIMLKGDIKLFVFCNDRIIKNEEIIWDKANNAFLSTEYYGGDIESTINSDDFMRDVFSKLL